ncbi:hypothetical protein G7046_g7933 [Stylonectria norvegica]|nr:hypothetical protein G7046_g7933 [Stylonectria norvegica]
MSTIPQPSRIESVSESLNGSHLAGLTNPSSVDLDDIANTVPCEGNNGLDIGLLFNDEPSVFLADDSLAIARFTGNSQYAAFNSVPAPAADPGPTLCINDDIANLRPTDTEIYQLSTHGAVTSLVLPASSNPLGPNDLVPSASSPSNIIHQLVPVPGCTMNVLEQPSRRLISKGCRQFLISILRTYPRMMAQLDHLPPFVHHVGCGLHFNDGEVQQVDRHSFQPTHSAPLKPLAACRDITQIFVSRNLNSDGFLWRTIESEHRWIISEKLGERFAELCPGPLSPPHERQSKPSWEEWIFEETRRRISLVCFLSALVLGSEGSSAVENPFFLPLPSNRAMWEARNSWTWEGEYGAFSQNFTANECQLHTVGDLAAAHMQQSTHLPALGKDLVLQKRPTPSPGPGEVLIRNSFIAINPVDWKRQSWGFKVSCYPAILGADVCGIVVDVGSSVIAFKPGDRVLGLAHAFCSGNNNHGAFQEYTLVNAVSTALLPEGISLQEGATLPTAVGTASMALFDALDLPRPSIEQKEDTLQLDSSSKAATSPGTLILVWGGASSAGSMTVQLAHLAGFTVFAAASECHHAYLRTLGASVLVDYDSPTAVEDLVAAATRVGTQISYAVDTISATYTLSSIIQVLTKSAVSGAGMKIAHTVGWPADLPKPAGIENEWIAADDLWERRQDLSTWLYNEALPKWLEQGIVVPARHRTIGGGLGGLQNGLNQLKKGVSGEKLVVEV